MATTMTWITPKIRGGSTTLDTENNMIKIESSSLFPKDGNPSSYPSTSSSGTTIGCTTSNSNGVCISLLSTFPAKSILKVTGALGTKNSKAWPNDSSVPRLTGELIKNCDSAFYIRYGTSTSDWADLGAHGYIKQRLDSSYERFYLVKQNTSTAVNSVDVITTKALNKIWVKAQNSHGGVMWGAFRLQLSYKDYTLTFKTLTDGAESATGGSVNSGGSVVTSDLVIDGQGDYTYTAEPEWGYKFKQWSWTDKNGVAHTQTDPTLVTNYNGLGKDLTVTAEFETAYSILVESNNDSAGSVSGGGDYGTGEYAEIEAISSEGFEFLGWYENRQTPVSTNNRYTFSVDKSTSFEAAFYPRVNITNNIPDAGTTSYTVDYIPGEPMDDTGFEIPSRILYVCTAVPSKNYKFSGWYSANDVLYETQPILTFPYTRGDSVDAPIEIKAKWERKAIVWSRSGRAILCG